ncbi:MAG: PAS domain-containing protein [Chloroflexi bacterium]|nr:PAS domain-containing protein [Chloroflexota bacterium]
MVKGKKPDKKEIVAPAVEVPEPATAEALEAGFPVVGIGASAGGLAAFEAFFANMPADTESGMAFVLVQHLAPDHKSILSDLVRRYTPMKVYEAEDGMKVLPNCTYIIPPNQNMAFLHGELYLTEPVAPRGLRLPIDYFFRSLAQDQRERAICIVLSGTGSDGTLGLKAIKGEGGMAMAQTPESAEYDGMPRTAIATGQVDYLLPPAEMPAQLIAYVKHAFGRKRPPVSTPILKPNDQLQKILILLRDSTRHDFSSYKQNTVTRRIERRMSVNQIDRMGDYLEYLRQNPAEVESLFRDLLIGVTSFFREPEAFAALRERAVPRLFDGLAGGRAVRVWVPACSTGEEAYSIAMLLQEFMETSKQKFKVQIFGTDIDRQAIEQARAGIYPASIAADVSAERLVRFFAQDAEGGAYHIRKSIRDMLVFSEQDVIMDPPLSRMGLISCRNLLIYMSAELQKRVISLFHYALNQDGFLFLGNSESIGESPDLFDAVERKWRLYRRKGVTSFRPVPREPALRLPGEVRPPLPVWAGHREKSPDVRVLTEKALLQQYAPASVVINERGEILYIHGHTGKYLEPALGEVSMDIARMAREGLRRQLTAAIRQAVNKKEPVRCPGLRVTTNGEVTTVNLTVAPFDPGTGAAEGLLLATFEDVLPEEKDKPETLAATATDDLAAKEDNRIEALERELQDKEEYLQTIIEELETSGEEMRSATEELQSANEELQSANEELETSGEELQSINEELSTVNTELQQKMDELSRASNDLSNLLAGTEIGTLFVDTQTCIRFFTPVAARVINLIPADVGRPVGHIVSNILGYDLLVEDIHAVMKSLIPRETEVQTREGLWYLLRILPYRTHKNVVDGAVVTLIDISERKITERKHNEEALRELNSLRRLAVVVRMYGWSESEALAMNIREVTPKAIRGPESALMPKLAQATPVEPFPTQRLAKDGRTVDVWLTATALVNEAGEVYAVATTEREGVRT